MFIKGRHFHLEISFIILVLESLPSFSFNIIYNYISLNNKISYVILDIRICTASINLS